MSRMSVSFALRMRVSFLLALHSQASPAPVAAPAKGGVELTFAMVRRWWMNSRNAWNWCHLSHSLKVLSVLKSRRAITVHFTEFLDASRGCYCHFHYVWRFLHIFLVEVLWTFGLHRMMSMMSSECPDHPDNWRNHRTYWYILYPFCIQIIPNLHSF